ncbi:hypothetical protein [Parasitella parasitica]|uniref:Uncharacterized protein n=1 Tax=Parasitella parasitica TaxID=35722 RepID=A0A0B7NPM6_9FUNG|nr:hypothetical protein [Parasitella parasitica]
MSTSTSSQKTVQLETTPRVYYAHYTAQPQYDLYPGLSRRVMNGFVPQRVEQKKRQQTDFLQMNITTSRRSYNPNDDPFWRPVQRQREDANWDLYPRLRRNASIHITPRAIIKFMLNSFSSLYKIQVENFGTDQMRSTLHAMENTITTL